MLAIICLSLILTFSYKFIELIIRILWSKDMVRYSILFWAVIIMGISPFFKGNLIYSSPVNVITTIPVLLILIIANYIISRFSGYYPIGKFNIINFVITYPIIEEFLFRGLILPAMNQYHNFEVLLQVMYLPVTFPVVISALLFSIAHLQYYRLSSQSIRYLIFAFIGGIFFGAITDLTHSILLSCLLHIEFNFFAVYFAKRASLFRL